MMAVLLAYLETASFSTPVDHPRQHICSLAFCLTIRKEGDLEQ